MDTICWAAKVSDGSQVVEHFGEYQIVPGERKPWVRLCSDLAKNKEHLVSLELWVNGRTVNLPMALGRFGQEAVEPDCYSLQYHIEGELGSSGAFEQSTFVDVVAHFPDFEVHYIQDTTQGLNSWIVVTRGFQPMVPTPRRESNNVASSHV